MCELLGLSSNRPATVNLSLAKLAEHGVTFGTYNDGWGVGFYEGLDVRVIKESTALTGSAWMRVIAELDLQSPLVIAHTRTATRGTRSYHNTQPFTRELAGRIHVFAHNGDLPGILDAQAFRPGRFAPIGDTDSERSFCVLLGRLAALWDRAQPPAFEEKFAQVARFAAEMRDMGPANFLYADGELLFAHGHRRRDAVTRRIAPPGLVMLRRRCQGHAGTLAMDALTVRGETLAGDEEQVVTLFASTALSGEPWQPLAEGELLAVAGGRVIARQLPGQDPVLLGAPWVAAAPPAGRAPAPTAAT